eukprot:TRINITY_DN2506_c0_g1_i1.p1 TRINITY_DN2506_c0_g1~~TRINITY_DN2506_c0_g1_i1.p1  ORF type:complete len:222 (+),score=60.89 TRINITY_DN2506_c0_g1_i1:59-667(+)
MAQRNLHEQELHTLIERRDWDALVNKCEEIELEYSNEPSNPIPFYGVHLFAYYFINDLNSARFLWKRIPTNIKAAQAELTTIWTIGQALWKREYSNVYKVLSQDGVWPAAFREIATLFTEVFRQRMIELVSKAFSTISVADLGVYLGVDEPSTLTFANSHNWTIDLATQTISPKPISTTKSQKITTSQLDSLTSYVAFLESK